MTTEIKVRTPTPVVTMKAVRVLATRLQAGRAWPCLHGLTASIAGHSSALTRAV